MAITTASASAHLAAAEGSIVRGSSNPKSFDVACGVRSGIAVSPGFCGKGLSSSLGLSSAVPSMKAFSSRGSRRSPRSSSLLVRAAKLPAGVEAPKEEPNLPISLWGFTEIAEIWNSRAAMIGLFALVAVEFVANQGILQMIGVDVGKGLDLPL